MIFERACIFFVELTTQQYHTPKGRRRRRIEMLCAVFFFTVDNLVYSAFKCKYFLSEEKKLPEYSSKAVRILKPQVKLLSWKKVGLYAMISRFFELQGNQ